jgi:cell division GTPase FtsZ
VPPDKRIFFQPLDLSHHGYLASYLPSEEILARLQSLDDGDIDALFLSMGLGGTLAGTAPHLAEYLKKSVSEPIFGLCTLPCRREGDERARTAADQLDQLLAALDGVILFDNESWQGKKSLMQCDDSPVRPVDLASLIGRKSAPPPPLTATERFYTGMNDLIARRITLLFRAGEYSDRYLSNQPQVVLDAGEIINTMEGMGLITIGYARDEIAEEGSLDILAKIRPGAPAVDDQHMKASRVVNLARRAVYDEMSTPVELEKAKKALILIAGHPLEMSMKGFMTVRKWIDRTIQGLELRSGDYPVKGSRFLGVFIILAGMDTLSRVEELRNIRERVKSEDAGKPEDVSAGDPGDATIIL